MRTKSGLSLLHIPLLMPTSNWAPPSLATLPSWKYAKRICIDVETFDPTLKQLGIGVRRGGYIVGVSFSIEDGPSAYLPIRHAGGDNLPIEQVLYYLKENAKDFSGDLVGANLAYDLDYLWQENIYFPKVRFYRDIQIADPLIYELHQSYSLQSIANRYGLKGKDELLLKQAAQDFKIDPKSGLWKLPARYVGAYAEADTQQPLLILRKQERILDNEDLWDIYNLESKVLPVLVKMRKRGVLINQEKLAYIESWAFEKEAESLKRVALETGIKIAIGDVWKPEVVAPALNRIGINLELTSSGKVSIQNEFLNSIDHVVAKSLAYARRVNKLRTTFVESIKRYMTNGRIHCDFKQIALESEDGEQKGARYGRLSATHPNLQQQPACDEFSRFWRSIYIPEEGSLWASCDYSQQEPRWTTHFAAFYNLDKAKLAAQAYHNDPKLDNHQFMADLTGIPRKPAKNIYLGLCYGQGGAKLCNGLGLPTRWSVTFTNSNGKYQLYFDTKEEALKKRRELGSGFVFEDAGAEGKHIIDTFVQRAPFIPQLAFHCRKEAEKYGFITTIGGRKLHFPQKENGSYDWTYKALNRLIQGSAADQTKSALIAIDEAGYFLQLQIHDEVTCSVGGYKDAENIAKIMSNVVPSLVPFRVDIETGPSWGDSK